MSTYLLFGNKYFKSAFTSRNIGIAAPALQKATDPIQQLFLDKIREYKQKSVDGKMVDATPEIEEELRTELDKIAKVYGGVKNEDMIKFPTFEWSEPTIDPINEEITQL